MLGLLIMGPGCSVAPPPTPDLLLADQITPVTRPDDSAQDLPAGPPTVTPAASATPVPTASGLAVPTPLPADARNYELCVGIASDSNGFGHVTYQIKERPDTVAVTYITPLYVPLQAYLDSLGLGYLKVQDQSLSAAGLTIASANYLESDHLYRLQRDRCKFIIITPFYPDVAVNLARPEDYVANLGYLLDNITTYTPGSRILVLNYYYAERADFTLESNGRGVTDERIDAFNAALAAACQPGGTIALYEQARCIGIQPFFDGMSEPYILGETTREQYKASLFRATQYSAVLDEYFEEEPDGVLIGDGIHLGPAGRDRLARELALIILEMSDEF